MQYIKLKEQLKDFTIFSLSDIKRIDNNFYRRRLSEWQDKGYLIKVIKGYYVFSSLKITENVLFEIANKIYNPSYVSFEMALSHYGLIPESVYGITSASTRRTYRHITKIAEFSYRAIKSNLFFGYDIVQHDNGSFKIATPEKALLDYFYLNPKIKNNDDYENLRINKEAFIKVVDTKRLREYLNRFKQKTLTKRVKDFLEFITNA